MVASLASRTRVNEQNLSRDAIDLMRSCVPPIEIVPNEILWEEEIVIDQQEFTATGRGKHASQFAAERPAPDDSDLPGRKRRVTFVKSRHYWLRRNNG